VKTPLPLSLLSVGVYMIGKRFGKWMVVDVLPDGRFLCKCDCGNQGAVTEYNLLHCNSRSCGCGRGNLISCNGESHTLKEWANILDVHVNTVKKYYRKTNNFVEAIRNAKR
jgi:hypothetical protein